MAIPSRAEIVDWINKAATIAGEAYGITRSIVTIVEMLGSENESQEQEIVDKAEKCQDAIIQMLDAIEALARTVEIRRLG